MSDGRKSGRASYERSCIGCGCITRLPGRLCRSCECLFRTAEAPKASSGLGDGRWVLNHRRILVWIPSGEVAS